MTGFTLVLLPEVLAVSLAVNAGDIKVKPHIKNTTE